VSFGPEAIATFESTCNVAQDHFSLNPPTTTSVTVCAKADPNFSGSRYIYWVNSQGETFQADTITSTNASATSTISVAGNYWVYFSDTDGSLRNKHAFTVSNQQSPQVDLAVFKTEVSGDVTAGGFVSYEVVASNRGPDTA